METSPPAVPRAENGERLLGLDVVRGVAVMGILLLNIVSFAMPQAAYTNPTAYGGAQGADLIVYLTNFILFDGRMRGLFALLFGASMLLVIERAQARGAGPAAVHFRRMFWLLLIGFAHLWLVWRGDILALYAIIGSIAFLLHRLAPHRLVALGIVLIVVQTLLLAGMPLEVSNATPANPERLAAIADYYGTPDSASIARALARYRGDYATILAARFAEERTSPFLLAGILGYETLAYMLFGMAALRSGMLRGEWSRAQLRRWAAIGFGVAIPPQLALAAWMANDGFGLLSVTASVAVLAVPLHPPMVIGWASLILLAMRPGGGMTQRVAAVGRMALTNYLATSLICTTLFYGYGLGWYGQLGRAELLYVIAAIWGAMLLWSKPWLDRFAFGPAEWLWRSLARGAFQPFRKLH